MYSNIICTIYMYIYKHIYLVSVDCVWNAWVNGTCTTTCGDGQQTNTRVKIIEEAYGGTCTGKSTDVVSCIDVECPGMYLRMIFV